MAEPPATHNHIIVRMDDFKLEGEGGVNGLKRVFATF